MRADQDGSSVGDAHFISREVSLKVLQLFLAEHNELFCGAITERAIVADGHDGAPKFIEEAL